MPPASIDELFARPGLALAVRANACAQVAVARGDSARLAATVQAARRAGCARQALEEGLLQGVLFYGFPRTITAFDTLGREWPTLDAPRGGALPVDEQAAAGRALFAAIYDRNAAAVEAMLAGFHGELHSFVLEVAYGRLLTRPGLPPGDRELVAVAVLAAIDQMPQLVAHGRGAMHFGASSEALREALFTALTPDVEAVEAAMARIVRSAGRR